MEWAGSNFALELRPSLPGRVQMRRHFYTPLIICSHRKSQCNSVVRRLCSSATAIISQISQPHLHYHYHIFVAFIRHTHEPNTRKWYAENGKRTAIVMLRSHFPAAR